MAELLAWVSWWNTAHELDALDGRTLRAWLDDPTPLTTVPAEDLRLFTLEDDGRNARSAAEEDAGQPSAPSAHAAS